MCIIIHKPKEKRLTDDMLRCSWDSNYQGSGLMYAKDNKLIIEKGMMTFNDFESKYRELENENLILHVRHSSAGDINENNCHPFKVNDDLAFVHNGTFNTVKYGGTDKCHSDTWYFNEKFLKPLVNKYGIDIIFDKTFKFLVKDYIKLNKIAFMDSRGRVSIYNSEKGEYNSGCWFSNCDYKVVRNRNIGNYSKYNKYSNNSNSTKLIPYDTYDDYYEDKRYNYGLNNTNIINGKKKMLYTKEQEKRKKEFCALFY